YNRFTVVIILNVASRVIGVVVDAVSDVLSLDKDEIRKAPEFASEAFDTRYITGLATIDGRLLVMVDIEKLMTAADMALVDATSVQ
ncbi:MAG TPA: chemotaxis protein CheW, partial [Ramlibacter sp.]